MRSDNGELLDISILDRFVLTDGTIRFNIGVSDRERIYLGYILESFEGWCNYTTPVRSKPVLQVDVSPDYYRDFMLLFDFLKNWKLK